jgi:hypothetical protein
MKWNWLTQTRGSHHLSACNAQADRRHDSDDGRQTRNEYWLTEGTSRFERCVDVQGKFTGRDLRLD